jgi:predicted GH43/DUF377 family glycosyl hydrolase
MGMSVVQRPVPQAVRLPENPIIAPRPENPWEWYATFNPAALYEGGRVHLLYRAIGAGNISTLGYASSADGIHVDERPDEPAYIPTQPFEVTPPAPQSNPRAWYRGVYTSGGGWGGAEDPRLTRIGERIYMTYVAYNGFDPPRVAITSISREDFLAKRWNWAPPRVISPPGVVDKNPCLLPERIGGKYVVFHRIFPNILIDFVDSLEFGEGQYLKGEYVIPPRPGRWDSRKVGAGAPPIKTPYGWLLIYHAVDDRDDACYLVGAMLLDLDDPTRVISRTEEPLIRPQFPYENEGHKSGVVYPCGAVLLGNRLLIYYGGADKFVCVAQVDAEALLDYLWASRPRRWGLSTAS